MLGPATLRSTEHSRLARRRHPSRSFQPWPHISRPVAADRPLCAAHRPQKVVRRTSWRDVRQEAVDVRQGQVDVRRNECAPAANGLRRISRFDAVNGRLYVEVTRMSFRRQSTYRGAMVAGTFTNFVWGFLLASVLRSVIGDGNVGGLTRTTATSFTFLAQGLIATARMFGDMTLVTAVRSGDVATELQRPWDWSAYRLSSDLGQSFFSTLTRGASIVVAGWVVYRLPLPAVSTDLSILSVF